MFAYAPENAMDVARAINESGGHAIIIHCEDGTRID